MAKYRVPVFVEVELDIDDVDGEAAAVAAVDETLQRAWDTDQGRKWITQGWHFEIELPAEVTRVVTT